jgi:enamine deaminase RidA (YjgF/YER057c/UK114 family)
MVLGNHSVNVRGASILPGGQLLCALRARVESRGGQARAALDNLRRGLEAVGASFADIVTADGFVTGLSDQDALNRVWAEYFAGAKAAATTVQVVRLRPTRVVWSRSTRLP